MQKMPKNAIIIKIRALHINYRQTFNSIYITYIKNKLDFRTQSENQNMFNVN